MITRKDFTKNDLCFYRSEDNYARKLGLQMRELLDTEDDLPTARLIAATYSAAYCHEPTVIFFDDDVLSEEPGLSLERGAAAGNAWIPTGIFHKIGFKYNNKKFEGWIYHGKLDPLSQFEKDELAQKYPEYFSEAKPVRGFFDEHLNEKIERNWTSNSQIERIMEDYDLTLENKAYLLFGRTPEHVFEFGMCSLFPTKAVRRIAKENGGTVNVDAGATYLSAKGNIDVSTVMCLGNIDEPFNLQQSWDYYVKQRPSEYRNNRRRSYGFTPLNWYKYLKAVIDAYEDAVKYTDTPTYKRGFFNEGNQNTLREEMEKKVIGSGHGWRIVCRNFKSVPWDRNRYKPGTVIVHLPRPGRQYFMCTPVVTEGISGQPQLTFDDPAKAQEYCNRINRISSTYRFEISKTRNDYECYKIPLGDGTEAWLATSNFPPQGSPKWKYLCDLFPDYFSNPVRGFFNESLSDGNPSDDEITAIVNNDILSDDDVCEKLFGGRNQDYILKACHSYCSWYKPAAPDGARTPQCYKLGVTCPFIINDFTEDPLSIRDSYRVYVEGKEINGESRWSRAKPRDWWESIVELYTFWEEHDTEHFTGPSNHLTRGFFDEDLKKEG